MAHIGMGFSYWHIGLTCLSGSWHLGILAPIHGLKENLSTTIARKIDDHLDNHQEETSAGDWVGSSHLTAERTSGKESNIFHKEVKLR